jgi:5-methylcytosine-specific restriction endonuclease McrA
MTEEHKQKISLALKGRPKSPEHARKVGEAHKGKVISDEQKDKIRLTLTGYKHTEEAKKNMRDSQIGRKHAPLSDESRANISAASKGRIPWNKGIPYLAIRGENHPNWKGGTYSTERQVAMQRIEYKLWRESIFVRDDYTCQECNVRGGELNADHIKPWALYPELRYELNNGRTLCIDCHRKTDTWGYKSAKPKAEGVEPRE